MFFLRFLDRQKCTFSFVRHTRRMSSVVSGKKVALVGSGNWGSAIATQIGERVRQLKGDYDERISMWCRKETLNDGRILADVINEEHVNVKYLPDRKIPDNVVAVPDLVQSVQDADILIFVIPHQFVKQTCDELKGKIKPSAFALTLIKGFYFDHTTKELSLVSDIIRNTLNIPCLSMMGANIANEVADQIFCEATVGSRHEQHSDVVRQLIDRPYFRLRFCPDVELIEILGALKNVVAMLTGFADGLKVGFNTRAAVLRLGFREMINFCRLHKQESSPDIYLESCGIADLIASASGGRNYNSAKKMAATHQSLREIERDDLNGQSLQGPGTAREAYQFLEAKNLLDQYPLLRDAHLICEQRIEPKQLLESLTNHPEFTRKK